MKPDLVWYAAYDEDVNEMKFIEKLHRIDESISPLLPEQIIPTVMMGWKLKLEFDVAYLVEDKNKMALMKLHLVSRKCLLKLFDLKNGRKVPTKFHPNGSYYCASIKKVNYNSI